MKKLLNLLMSLALTACVMTGCKDEVPVPVPIAPVLEEVTMPSEDNSLPGSAVAIRGRGFASGDILHFTSKSGESNFAPEVVAADDQQITFLMPETAGGTYEVSVERADLTSKLPGEMKVPYLLVLSGVQLPSGAVAKGAEIEITGEGFEAGDVISFVPSVWPTGTAAVTAVSSLTDDGIKVTVPAGCAGTVALTGVRGERKVAMGNISIPLAVGDAAGGGVVFYVTDGGTKGYICSGAIGGGQYNFGPGSLPTDTANAVATAVGEGKANTDKLIAFINNYRTGGGTWDDQTAAERAVGQSLAVDGITYADWYLPSKDELIEIFKARAAIAAGGVTFPANNYWSSSEGTPDPVWGAWYVNFYEAVNIVSDPTDKVNWKIGIIPVRSY